MCVSTAVLCVLGHVPLSEDTDRNSRGGQQLCGWRYPGEQDSVCPPALPAHLLILPPHLMSVLEIDTNINGDAAERMFYRWISVKTHQDNVTCRSRLFLRCTASEPLSNIKLCPEQAEEENVAPHPGEQGRAHGPRGGRIGNGGRLGRTEASVEERGAGLQYPIQPAGRRQNHEQPEPHP